jgi:hypothetical protein
VSHVLLFAPDAVLGTEERVQLPAAAGVQEADGVAEIPGHRALVGDQPDLPPEDRLRVFQ